MMALDRVTVRFGVRDVLRDLSFAVAAGRTLAILGPNGRGKTTALRTLLGLQKPTSGTRRAPRVVGYVPQAVGFAHPYRVLDVVVMGRADRLGLFGRPGAADRDVALEALERVGVARLADAAFDRLSGGERQLVLLARALATGSPAIVLDEPAAALDLGNEMRLLALIDGLRHARGHAIAFTTHDPNHALAVADDAVLMLPGGDALCGPVAETVTEANLRRLYGVAMCFVDVAGAPDGPPGHRVVVPLFAGAAAPGPLPDRPAATELSA